MDKLSKDDDDTNNKATSEPAEGETETAAEKPAGNQSEPSYGDEDEDIGASAAAT